MTTVRDIVSRALRRLAVVAADENPSALDASHGLAALNELVRSWAYDGVDVLLQADFTLNDGFVYWVPPAALTAETIAEVLYQGTWDATANAPALASAVGTEGYVYRVATAGGTTLDGVATWAAGDYAVFDGAAWSKGLASGRFDGGVAAMLALRLSPDFGVDPKPMTVKDAANGWAALQAAFVKAPTSNLHDTALVRAPSNRYIGY